MSWTSPSSDFSNQMLFKTWQLSPGQRKLAATYLGNTTVNTTVPIKFNNYSVRQVEPSTSTNDPSSSCSSNFSHISTRRKSAEATIGLVGQMQPLLNRDGISMKACMTERWCQVFTKSPTAAATLDILFLSLLSNHFQGSEELTGNCWQKPDNLFCSKP